MNNSQLLPISAGIIGTVLARGMAGGINCKLGHHRDIDSISQPPSRTQSPPKNADLPVERQLGHRVPYSNLTQLMPFEPIIQASKNDLRP